MTACPTCGSIGDLETGSSKYGFPQYDETLPFAFGDLEELASNLSGGRGDTLYRCPACGWHFHYELDYEFIVPGTEDSETLRRISDEEAAALRRRIGGPD